MKSYAKLVFNTFSFELSKSEIFLVYREVPGFSKIADIPSPPSLSSRFLCFARRPPYAASGPRPRRVRGQMDPGKPPASLGLPLGTSPRSHASWAPCRADTTPRHAQRRCPLRPLAVESPRAKSTAPRRYSPRPGAPWPIGTPRIPPSCGFSSFLLLPPLRHGRRDLARADRLPQPYIVPSDHRSSFATS